MTEHEELCEARKTIERLEMENRIIKHDITSIKRFVKKLAEIVHSDEAETTLKHDDYGGYPPKKETCRECKYFQGEVIELGQKWVQCNLNESMAKLSNSIISCGWFSKKEEK